MVEENKTPFQGYKAEYSMFSDYDRFFFLLKKADDLHFQIVNYELRAAREFYSILNTLFVNFVVYFPDVETKKFEERFTVLGERTEKVMSAIQNNDFQNFSDKAIFKDLSELYRDILKQKQLCGLGILRKKEYSQEERLRQALE